MPWIKRNLGLVVGGVVALALLVLAGFYLWTKMSADQAMTESVNQATEQLKSLVNRNPHPGTDRVDNISAAKEEEAKLSRFVGEVRQHFREAAPQKLTSRELGALLDNTINELQTSAESAGVDIPSGYWFTFSAQKTAVNFTDDAIEPLASRLAEIKGLCEVLFEAKVSELVGIKRVAVPGESTFGSQDYMSTNKVETNTWAIVTPYEVTFKSFTAELADVLEGLVRSPEAYVVKNIAVHPASAAQQTQDFTSSTPMMPYQMSVNPYSRYGMPGAGMRGGMDPALAARYGMRAPPGGMMPPMMPTPPAQPAQPARPAGRGPTTVVDEKPLQFTMLVNVVKIKPPTK